MRHRNRREFIQTSAVLLAAIVSSSFYQERTKPLLSFSTLGCPDWPLEKIISFAVKHNYQGLEIRGLLRQLDLSKCPEFSNAQNRKATVNLMKENNLSFVGLGSSANLHFADATLRQKNLDEAKRFIDLAQQIHCPFVRVFPNNFPKEQEKHATLALISNGLLELAEHANGSDVSVLMETHGDLVKTEDLLAIMHTAQHQHTGLVWDVSNMWTITKEPPIEAYAKLKKFIKHTHFKDANMVNGKAEYTLLGKGEVPIFEAIDILLKDNYKGFYSFEWEKLWHPEIAEPEIALADYSRVFREHLTKRKLDNSN